MEKTKDQLNYLIEVIGKMEGPWPKRKALVKELIRTSKELGVTVSRPNSEVADLVELGVFSQSHGSYSRSSSWMKILDIQQEPVAIQVEEVYRKEKEYKKEETIEDTYQFYDIVLKKMSEAPDGLMNVSEFKKMLTTLMEPYKLGPKAVDQKLKFLRKEGIIDEIADNTDTVLFVTPDSKEKLEKRKPFLKRKKWQKIIPQEKLILGNIRVYIAGPKQQELVSMLEPEEVLYRSSDESIVVVPFSEPVKEMLVTSSSDLKVEICDEDKPIFNEAIEKDLKILESRLSENRQEKKNLENQFRVLEVKFEEYKNSYDMRKKML